jgi:hypothetical protein
VRLFPLLLPALAACSAVSVTADFEGGSVGKVEQVSATQFRCGVAGQADQENRNRQASWYFFRLDGAKGKEITFTLTDLRGEYNYKAASACATTHPPV